jgi:hypothetical protein
MLVIVKDLSGLQTNQKPGQMAGLSLLPLLFLQNNNAAFWLHIVDWIANLV